PEQRQPNVNGEGGGDAAGRRGGEAQQADQQQIRFLVIDLTLLGKLCFMVFMLSQ
ncbi:unnamed protein product, partial [Heterosigma akashiwo]